METVASTVVMEASIVEIVVTIMEIVVTIMEIVVTIMEIVAPMMEMMIGVEEATQDLMLGVVEVEAMVLAIVATIMVMAKMDGLMADCLLNGINNAMYTSSCSYPCHHNSMKVQYFIDLPYRFNNIVFYELFLT